MPPEFFGVVVGHPVPTRRCWMPDPTASHSESCRVRIFMDFWNFQLYLEERYGTKYRLDWRQLGPWFAKEAGKVASIDESQVRFEGMVVYMSYNPKSSSEAGLRKWAANVLDRFPGVQVVQIERKPKRPPKCPTCHETVGECPKCQSSMAGMVEKGVDTLIVTDMVRLAWEDAYDIGVLVSADRDFVPAVEFLSQKGIKVMHAGFQPYGSDLATKCWGSFDIGNGQLSELARQSDR